MIVNKKIIKVLAVSLVGIIFITATISSIKILTENSDINTDKVSEIEGSITFVSNRVDKQEEIEALINEFELINPKVKVNVELIGNVEELLLRKMSVGELPDVTLVPSGLKKSEFNKYFLPIDNLGFNEENIYSYQNGVGEDKQLYMITTSISAVGVIYNKKIFQEANILEIPKTKEEFLDTSEKIKSINITPIAINYKQRWALDLWLTQIPYSLEKDFEKNITLNPNEVLYEGSYISESLDFVREIVKRGYCEEDLLNYDWQQFKNDMANNKVAMFLWNSNIINQLEDFGANKEDFGVFPFPESEVMKVVGDYSLAVSKESNNPEVSKAFLKFIIEDDRYVKAINTLSPLKNNVESKEFLDSISKEGLYIDLFDEIRENKSYDEREEVGKFLEIKEEIGLDSNFIQEYIISDNIEELKNEMNEKWKIAFKARE